MNKVFTLLARTAALAGFRNSRDYWEKRYRFGGHSGEGSRGESARYKADVVNNFIRMHGIESLVEFGCGDGYQLGMFEVRNYLGIDISPTILAQCRSMYQQDKHKSFLLDKDYSSQTADLAMSMDVIFHLVEDAVYDAYMTRLFEAGSRYVMIYSTSADMQNTGTPHVRHRNVATDVAVRFGNFSRMHGLESQLPEPVRFDRGLPTSFFLYQRTT